MHNIPKLLLTLVFLHKLHLHPVLTLFGRYFSITLYCFNYFTLPIQACITSCTLHPEHKLFVNAPWQDHLSCKHYVLLTLHTWLFHTECTFKLIAFSSTLSTAFTALPFPHTRCNCILIFKSTTGSHNLHTLLHLLSAYYLKSGTLWGKKPKGSCKS